MKTKLIILIASVALSLLFLWAPASAQKAPGKFRLVFSGGFGSMTGGDMPRVVDDRNALLGDLASSVGFTVTDKLKEVNWGPQFEAEFCFWPARNLGVSFAAGCLRKSEETRGAMRLAQSASLSIDWIATYSLIPLKLSITYVLPVVSKTSVYAKAGINYSFGRIDYLIRTDETILGASRWERTDGEATDSGFGFHGGLGVEYQVTPALAIMVEAAGQYSNLNDWDVDNIVSTESGDRVLWGKFWYAEELNETLGRHYATFLLSDVPPDGTNLRNVRKAAFGFSGISLKAGMKISF